MVDLEMEKYCVENQNGRIDSESTSLMQPEVSNKCKIKQVNNHQKTGRTFNFENVDEQTTRKKVKYASMYGKKKGSESNQPETKCTKELQNSVPVVEKKGSTVPPKLSVNSDGHQGCNSIRHFFWLRISPKS